MLIAGIEVICLECHSEVKEQPHLVAGFSNKGHPLGDEKTTTPAADPLRPGKQFYCGSCHQPHKADFPKLNRLDPGSATFCQRCHEK